MALPLSSNNSQSNNYAEINRLIKKVEGKDRVQVYKDDSGTRRVLIGKGKNDFYGLKVSKANKDVYEVGNADLVFNSDNNVLKVVASGSTSTTITSLAAYSTSTVTVAHSLGVVPAFHTYVTMPSNFLANYAPTGVLQLPAPFLFADSAGLGVIMLWVTSRVDSTNLYFDIVNPTSGALSGSYVFSFKYYILQETAA